MKISILVAVLISLTGCETTPETVAECEYLFTVEQEIEACKDRVVRREDRRVELEHQEALDEALAKKCYREQRGVWDQNSRRCKDRSML